MFGRAKDYLSSVAWTRQRKYLIQKKLRTPLVRGGTLVAPGAADALSARLIEAHGYECVYIGSYATAASRFAIPDTGLLTLDGLIRGQGRNSVFTYVKTKLRP